MKRLLVILGLIAVSCFSTAAQTPAKPATDDSATQEALIKLTKEWVDAEGRRDGATLDRLLADDFAGVAPNGAKVTKKMVVPDPKGPGGGFSFTADDYVARIYGDMGVVTGNGTWKTKDQGTLCFTVAFVKRAERWQIVTIHISQVQQP
ncbi:MAG TPA: nuclear transport factor 2 family protein [Pyrinomonadaceae bacterium]|nr:nuclear transport factor 2 family protein [Pyrinomonadaceae bacterium]